ncbi:uncharacterized protein LOC126840214, partial [Adelges cooleyi]|uniref:uncharacterized protein LOC126840214 n=1 Tax=Adelges cooleyi TaxID=133065 RepID=UPI0021806BD1
MSVKSNILKVVLIVILVVFILYYLEVTFNEAKTHTEFEQFLRKYNKSYNNETERMMRFERFQEALSSINKLNRNCGGYTKYGITRFADLSPEEFAKRHLTPRTTRLTGMGGFYMRRPKRSVTTTLLENVDWRNKGAITAVRDQKDCGACWAISVVEVIESVYAIKTGSLQAFSVQEMLDCSGGFNQGCLGGSAAILLLWMAQNGIIVQYEDNYPTIYENQICKLNNFSYVKEGVRVTSFLSLNFMNREDLLLSYIIKSPVAVAVNALSWQHYAGGIIRQCENNMNSLNHAAQIVGYVLGNNPYYIIKNSWGTDYGINGYVHVAIGNNECGIGWEVDVVTAIAILTASKAHDFKLNDDGPVKFDRLDSQIKKISKNDFIKSSQDSEWTEECKCVSHSDCVPEKNVASIDIRIVTKPNKCPTGKIFCCKDPSIENPLLACGKITPLDIEGIKINPDQAKFGEFPWQALFLTIDNSFVSNGVLIGKKHIISTAHFITSYTKNSSALKVRLGDWDVYRNVEPLSHVERSIASIAVHPGYDSSSLHNDIAVITLSEPVVLSQHISPVCVPISASNPVASTQLWTDCRVSGWGAESFEQPRFPGILKKVNVPVWQRDKCVARLRSTRLGEKFDLHEGFLCAGGEEHEDACTGDGGSPLVCEVDSVTYLVGLVSWGIGCGSASVPGVYVDVSKYILWIEKQI